MTFANAAPCAKQCNFCSQCVHYRTNVRIQQRRERQERDRRRGVAPPPPPEPAPSPAKRARTISQEPFVDVLLAAARDPLAVPQSAPARLATPFFSDAAMAPPPPRASSKKRPHEETPPVDKAPPALSPTPPERRPELAREDAPAQPFEIVAVDDSPPEEPPPVPPLSTQVTPLEEEPDVIQQNSRSLPILLEETPPPIAQRSHSAPVSDTTRHYVDSQSPRKGLLAGHTLAFAIGSGLNKPQAEALALKVKMNAGRLVKGAGKKASDGIVRERASIEDRRRAFGAATVVICGPQARVDSIELQGARKCASVNWLTDAFGSKRLGHVDDYAPLPAVVVERPPSPVQKKPRTSWPERMKRGLACQRAPKPEGELPPNDRIVKKLEELCEFYESSDDGVNQFKLRGTRRAINKLKLLGRDLTDDDVEESALRRILGSKFKVGSNKETIKKIQELHESGDLDRLRTWRADPRRCAIMELSKVWGIGYRKAQTLIDKYNIWSVAELKIKVEENPKLVEARVHRTLRCHDDLQLRMSREEALEIGDRVRSCARAVFSELLPSHDVAKLKVEGPMGSYRRGQPDCGDVDVLVTHEDWLDDPERSVSLEKQSQESSLSRSSYARTRNLGDEEATEGEDPDYGAQRSRASRDRFLATLRDRLHSDGFLTDHLGGDGFQKKTTTVQGEVPGAGCSSYMGICRPRDTHRRLDVKVYAPQHYAYAMIYFTGNDYFNRSMRCYAKACGYSLCDKGLRKAARSGVSHRDGKYIDNKVAVGRLVVCDTEKDVFDVLGLDYKEPHERNVSDNATEVAEKARRLFEEKRRGGVVVDSDSDDEDARPAGRFRL